MAAANKSQSARYVGSRPLPSREQPGLRPSSSSFDHLASPCMDGHAVLLADRCSPDTSHRKLPLPLLLPLLPLLLFLTLWIGCMLAATIYALQLVEQLLEVLDPTPPDQFQDRSQPSSVLFAETSTSRLTRSGSFCCGWLWATNGPVAPERRGSHLRPVQRFLRAPRRRLERILAESSIATLLQQAAALWRGGPLRRGGSTQLRRVIRKRAYFFVLARDELVWHATEAASSRGAAPAGSIRLDSIVEAPRPPASLHRVPPSPPTSPPAAPLTAPLPHPASSASSTPTRPRAPPAPWRAACSGAGGASLVTPRGGGRRVARLQLPAARSHLRLCRELDISTAAARPQARWE